MLKKRTYGTRVESQTMTWQKCGNKYAIHTLRKQYEETDSDAIIRIDGENAFNSLNRNLASKKLQINALVYYPLYRIHTLIHANTW